MTRFFPAIKREHSSQIPASASVYLQAPPSTRTHFEKHHEVAWLIVGRIPLYSILNIHILPWGTSWGCRACFPSPSRTCTHKKVRKKAQCPLLRFILNSYITQDFVLYVLFPQIFDKTHYLLLENYQLALYSGKNLLSFSIK